MRLCSMFVDQLNHRLRGDSTASDAIQGVTWNVHLTVIIVTCIYCALFSVVVSSRTRMNLKSEAIVRKELFCPKLLLD